MKSYKMFTKNIEALLEGATGKKVGFILGWIDTEEGMCTAVTNLKEEAISKALDEISDTFKKENRKDEYQEES